MAPRQRAAPAPKPARAQDASEESPRRGIFVSYRRSDAAGEAGRLADHLGAQLGAGNVFLDVADIASGDDWRQRLDQALDSCDVVLVVVGQRWLEGEPGHRRIDEPRDMVSWEVGRALGRGLRVAQVLVQGAAPLEAESLPPSIAALAMRQAFQLRHESFAADVRELVAQIRAGRRARSPLAGAWRSSDLAPWLPRVIDSGPDGTCAAITIVNALELLLVRAGAPRALSVRYLYEKVLRSQRRDDSDALGEGVHMLAALFVAGFFGVPEEKLWPYRAGRNALPKGKTWRTLEADPGRCCRGDFFRADGIADVVRQLAAGRPVIAAAEVVGDTWTRTAMRTGQIPMPPPRSTSDDVTTVLLTGYDAGARRFSFVATWGTSWGRKGRGTLTLDVARRVLQPDALWSVQLAADTVAELREERINRSRAAPKAPAKHRARPRSTKRA